MSHKFEKLYFIWQRYGGGTTMGCYQPFLACYNMGIPASVLGMDDLKGKIHEMKNSAFFFMKVRVDQNTINQLRNNNNTVVLYPGDGHEDQHLSYFGDMKNINGVIVGSQNFKDSIDLLDTDIQTTVIPANHDYFLDASLF